jgi:Ca2+-binding EF-hand superfamily protein
MVNSIWYEFDTDRSGKLNRSETFKFIKSFLSKKCKPSISYLVFSRYFNEMDINKDGFISKSEMAVFVMNFLSP